MNDTSTQKLSISLTLDSLKEIVEEMESLTARLDELRALRDEFLIDAYGSVPVTKLARLTHLSRERVGKIASPVQRSV